MTGRHDLLDREWAIIAPLLPNKPRGVARVDDRRVIDGIFDILRSGAPGRDLPERYGPRATVYNRTPRRTPSWTRRSGVGRPDAAEERQARPGRGPSGRRSGGVARPGRGSGRPAGAVRPSIPVSRVKL